MNRIPERNIEVVGGYQKPRQDYVSLVLGKDIRFKTAELESFGCKRWEPIVYDAMVVAAAVEYADRVVKRPIGGWKRRLTLRISVHELTRWRSSGLASVLHEALSFLTGDEWSIEFIRNTGSQDAPSQECLPLSVPAKKVIPFSNGMDSTAVAGLVGAQIADGLVLVRLGSRGKCDPRPNPKTTPFLGVPYEVKAGRAGESTSRSRGFRFALLGGIAAYLADADSVIIPESGQGAIGPALVPVAHTYPDYRNHPRFTEIMTRLMFALFGKPICFEFPRLWHTKGETLREYVTLTGSSAWKETKSCWRNNRWGSVDGQHRQCGTCAACMLRRMSVFNAGENEDEEKYICENLCAESLLAGIHPHYKRFNTAFSQYACAGTMHLKHLSEMARPELASERHHHAIMLSRPLGLSVTEVETNLENLLVRHSMEWERFRNDLGESSFVSQWARDN